MILFYMALLRESVGARGSRSLSSDFSALWPLSSALQAAGQTCRPGELVLVEGAGSVEGPRDTGSWLRFALDRTPPEPEAAGGSEVLLSRRVEVTDDQVILRVDQVSFPPDACAWRHVHPGPGIRHLLKGALHLQADDHAKYVSPGDSWFEAANSPVRATADAELPETAFIRFMALPVAYHGKPSIHILDPADAERPRLQTTRRYLDQIVSLPQG